MSDIILYNLLIDIDGTVTDDIPNEEAERMPSAIPFPNAVEHINRLYEKGHTITFFTSRTESMRLVTEEWLNRWGFKYNGVIMNKPRGGNYIWIDNLDAFGIVYPKEFTWRGDADATSGELS